MVVFVVCFGVCFKGLWDGWDWNLLCICGWFGLGGGFRVSGLMVYVFLKVCGCGLGEIGF